MSESDLPPDLIRFIHSSIPTYSAALLLLFLVRSADTRWRTDELVPAIRPTVLTAAMVEEYVAHFTAAGLLTRDSQGRFRYDPSSEETRAAVASLQEAYDRQPVTLVRTIYSIANARIQSFADAFRLKRDS